MRETAAGDALIAQLTAIDNGAETVGELAALVPEGPARKAIESQVRQVRHLVTGCLALIQGAADEGCRHENRINESTIGNEAWTCRDCGASYDESAARAAAAAPQTQGD